MKFVQCFSIFSVRDDLSTNARIRCRQCRALVTTADSNDLKDGHLIKHPIRDIHAKQMEPEDPHTQSSTARVQSRPCATIEDQREVFLVEDVFAEWIQQEIISSGWTKGKLKCVKCTSNVGSFDYVSGKKCECKQFDLPPLHFNVSKIDIELSECST